MNNTIHLVKSSVAFLTHGDRHDRVRLDSRLDPQHFLAIVLQVGFRGWTADAIDFYDGLEDNSKGYWQAHKAVYEQAVRRPMEELLAELAGQLGAGRIFRPNRDVRFSAVDAEPAGSEVTQMVAAVRGAGIEITSHDRLKTAPRGYPKDHPRIGLLCLKGLIAWRQWPAAAWLATPEAKSRLIEFFAQTDPIQDWLDSRVGPSQLPRG